MRHAAFEIVKTAVEELAEELGYEELAKVTQETELFGGTDGIDSLSLVRLVSEIERAAETRFSRGIVLADERAMSRRNSPFRTVGTLSELLEERLGEVVNG